MVNNPNYFCNTKLQHFWTLVNPARSIRDTINQTFKKLHIL